MSIHGTSLPRVLAAGAVAAAAATAGLVGAGGGNAEAEPPGKDVRVVNLETEAVPVGEGEPSSPVQERVNISTSGQQNESEDLLTVPAGKVFVFDHVATRAIITTPEILEASLTVREPVGDDPGPVKLRLPIPMVRDGSDPHSEAAVYTGSTPLTGYAGPGQLVQATILMPTGGANTSTDFTVVGHLVDADRMELGGLDGL